MGGHTNKHTRKRPLRDPALPSPLRARLQGPPAPPPQPPAAAGGGSGGGSGGSDDDDDDDGDDDGDGFSIADSWTSALAAADAAAAARGDLTPSAGASQRALSLRANTKEARFLRYLHDVDKRIGAGAHLAATFAELLHAVREGEASSPAALTLSLSGPLSEDLNFEFHRRVVPPGAPVLRQWERKRLCIAFAAQGCEDLGGWGWVGANGQFARRSLVLKLAEPPPGVATPVPLGALHDDNWELSTPKDVRSKGAKIRAWVSGVLAAWAAAPLPPIPIQTWEYRILWTARNALHQRYRGFRHPFDYPHPPGRVDMVCDRTVRLKDGTVVRCHPPPCATRFPLHIITTPIPPLPPPPSAPRPPTPFSRAPGVAARPDAARRAGWRHGGRGGGGARRRGPRGRVERGGGGKRAGVFGGDGPKRGGVSAGRAETHPSNPAARNNGAGGHKKKHDAFYSIKNDAFYTPRGAKRAHRTENDVIGRKKVSNC